MKKEIIAAAALISITTLSSCSIFNEDVNLEENTWVEVAQEVDNTNVIDESAIIEEEVFKEKTIDEKREDLLIISSNKQKQTMDLTTNESLKSVDKEALKVIFNELKTVYSSYKTFDEKINSFFETNSWTILEEDFAKIETYFSIIDSRNDVIIAKYLTLADSIEEITMRMNAWEKTYFNNNWNLEEVEVKIEDFSVSFDEENDIAYFGVNWKTPIFNNWPIEEINSSKVNDIVTDSEITEINWEIDNWIFEWQEIPEEVTKLVNSWSLDNVKEAVIAIEWDATTSDIITNSWIVSSTVETVNTNSWITASWVTNFERAD